MEKFEDTLLSWLERDVRYGNFPIQLSNEWIPDPEGNDEHIIRLEYKDGAFINFPYDSEVYDHVWKFFNKYWKSRKLISPEELICSS